MPIVTIKYQLPAESAALESALLGAEYATTINAMRDFLTTALVSPRRSGDYRRAAKDALAELDRLTGRDKGAGDDAGADNAADRAEYEDAERESGRAD